MNSLDSEKKHRCSTSNTYINVQLKTFHQVFSYTHYNIFSCFAADDLVFGIMSSKCLHRTFCILIGDINVQCTYHFPFPSNSTYYGKHFGNLILCTFNLKQWFFSHVTLILCRGKLYSRTAKIVYREAECETPNYTLFNLWAYMSKECSIYCTYNRVNVFPH